MNKPALPLVNQAIAISGVETGKAHIAAKGEGELAQRILAAAREHDIPVKEAPELVHLLSEVPLGDDIPESLYIAVAEILAFAFMLREKARQENMSDE